MKSYRIAVFSRAPNRGNHCLVYLVSDELTTDEMQSMAASAGLSETAFLCLQDNKAILRIFSPLREMTSCLHATLAACYVMQHEAPSYDLYFNEHLVAPQYVNGALALRVPLLPDAATGKAIGLGLRIQFANALSLWAVATASHKLRLMIEYSDEQAVNAIHASSFANIAHFFPEVESFFVYALTTEPNTYVGRMFAPQLGIAEDPVNGNSCIALASILKARTKGLEDLKVRQAHQCSVEITIEKDNALVKANCCIAETGTNNIEMSASITHPVEKH
ncbi:PhzF family phenazine biosynthesis protein [Bowmanella yangjiangensis]|uniref:PhzF family phenazine biosynthesis protein n=1 Tax=Bowmanella yangjiangensis TaxID=2811230 RepID=A0ABS3CUC1_9ALTE|nr:PhzF family phenazine biosynthesis protein [Bowmanella yangjiangensis]MBN7819736.1 PhzF family phenazine biosynthesis protein [Bowmanella yangjiangensis]